MTRKMPPWKANPHIGKWSNDPSLSAAEIDTIKAWVDNGKPEGDPKHLPAPPVFADGWRAAVLTQAVVDSAHNETGVEVPA